MAKGPVLPRGVLVRCVRLLAGGGAAAVLGGGGAGLAVGAGREGAGSSPDFDFSAGVGLKPATFPL